MRERPRGRGVCVKERPRGRGLREGEAQGGASNPLRTFCPSKPAAHIASERGEYLGVGGYTGYMGYMRYMMYMGDVSGVQDVWMICMI